jgi:hypothetical protein
MPRLNLPLLLGCFLLAAAPAQAAKVKVWHRHTRDDYEKARFDKATVSSVGALRLARRLEPFAEIDASHVWALAEDSKGNLYAATGGEGKLFRISPEGKVSVAYAAEGSQVLSLAVGPDDTVYAGIGPTGRIIALPPGGKARVFCETGASYVWALALDAKQKVLYAGTGPDGRIYRIGPDGKPAVFYDARQDHVLCLAVAPDGTVYAGTDTRGLVYRIDARGKGFVLYEAPQSEIRTLVLGEDALYVGTSSPAGGRRGSGSGSSSGVVLESKDKPADAVMVSRTRSPGSAAEVASNEKKKDKEESKKSSTGHSASAPSTPGGGENSVYRIAYSGGVREVFRSKVLILSLLRQDDRFFVGTGMGGQLFEVEESSREFSELARLDHGQVLCLLRRANGSVVVGTGDTGRLYLLRDGYEKRGTVTSPVFDAKLISRWGALRWQADTPEGTAVGVAVRSGNVSEPDETWSDWSEVQGDGREALAAAPPARFLQYRVALNTDNPATSPAVRALSVRYATTNQAPELHKLKAPDLDAEDLDDPRKLKFSWDAKDANEDNLSYSVWVRKEGWDSWVRLAEGLDDDDYTWDTTATPSGIYRLKVVASDRPSNPEKEALTAERLTAPFVVCHTPPEVKVTKTGVQGGRVAIEAKASSPWVRLKEASFAVNGKKWVSVFTADGLCDSRQETFRFRTEALPPGTYVLVVKVKDAAGNVGSGDVVFTVTGPEGKK